MAARMDPKVQRLLITAVFGIFVGWLGSFIVGSPRGGLIGLLIAGLLGSFVGSYLFQAMGWRLGFGRQVDTILESAIGAAIVLLIAKVFLA